MKTIRIFISSPGDVAVERDKARKVVENLQKRYAGRLRLDIVMWEDLPLMATAPFQSQIDGHLHGTEAPPGIAFQEGVDLLLTGGSAVDISVFILWARLGSPLGAAIRKPDGSEYRSGTEREFDLMLAARAQSPENRPEILVYVRQDDRRFKSALQEKPTDEIEEMLRQHKLADQFIREQFHDEETGGNLRAYHTFPEPNTFAERLKVHLRNLLDRIVMDGGLGFAPWEGSPYRGLEVFRSEHAPIFFGRDEEICDILERLRAQAQAGCAFLLLVGASGSGKSSLARAGVLPALETDNPDETVAEWRTATLTPGECADGLCRGLTRTLVERVPELRGADENLDDLEAALSDGKGRALTLLLQRAFAGGTRGPIRLVLLVDQLEELFTHRNLSGPEISAFLAALQGLAVSGCVWVLATVRSDFYDRCQRFPALMAMKGARGQKDLLPPEPSDLHRIITGPAVLAGVSFEKNPGGDSLDQRILNDAVGHPEALPLLEFTLAQLYEARTPEGLLTFAAYDKLGGVEGAIGRHAEAVFSSLPEPVRATFGPVFQALVSLDETDDARPVRRRIPLETLSTTPGRRQLVEALLAARLLSSDRGEVFVAHEALLRRWERAVQWIEANRDRLRVRDRIAVRMAEGAPLAENDPLTPLARHHLAENPDTFDPVLRDYIATQLAMLDAAKRSRERVRRGVVAALSAMLLLAVIGGAIAIRQWRTAETHRADAVARRHEAEQARDQADASRKQAEDWVEFMTFTMRDKLMMTRQTNLMDDITRAVEGSYKKREELPPSAGSAFSDDEDRLRSVNFNNQGDVLSERGDFQEAEKLHRKALKIAVSLATRNPGDEVYQRDLWVSHIKIGKALLGQPDYANALLAFQASLEVAKRLAATDPSNADSQLDLSLSYENIGSVLRTQGDLAGALNAYQASISALERFVALAPDNRRTLILGHNDVIAELLREQGDFAGALIARQKTLAVAQQQAVMFPFDDLSYIFLGYCHKNVGEEFKAQGNLPEALKAFRESHANIALRAHTDHSGIGYLIDLIECTDLIADLLMTQGDLPGALNACRESMALTERLVKNDPKNTDWQRDLSVCHNNIGDVLRDQGDLAGALNAYRESLAVAKRLEDCSPDYADWKVNLAPIHGKIADVLYAQENFSGAIEAYREARMIYTRIKFAKTATEDKTGSDANDLESIGTRLKEEGDHAGALNLFRESLAVRARLAAKDPADSILQNALAHTHAEIGDLLGAMKDLAGALSAHREALAILTRLATADSTDAEMHLSDLSYIHERIGEMLASHGDFAGALSAHREALAIRERLAEENPDHSYEYELVLSNDHIGNTLRSMGDQPGALSAFREALAAQARLVAETPAPRQMEESRDLFVRYMVLVQMEQGRDPEVQRAWWKKMHNDLLDLKGKGILPPELEYLIDSARILSEAEK